MTYSRDIEERISLWMEEEGVAHFPDRILEATFEQARHTRQAGSSPWRTFPMPRLVGSVAAVGAAGVVLAVVAVIVLRTVPNQPGVGGPAATSDPRTSFLGTWLSTSDADGGTQTMTVERADNNAVDIVVTDTIATVCGLTPSTMTGTGIIDGNNLVIPTPDYRCDDGSEPQTISGPSLEEQLRNLTYSRDPERDILTLGGGVWLRAGAEAPSPAPQASEPTMPPSQAVPPSEAEVTELLNGFLEARIAGEGAEQYLHSLYPDILSEDIPLLYATSSGAPYERAEFEPVTGIEWPYGFVAFKVRLFAGDTVVEQLFFMPHDDPQWFPADGRLGLEYQPDGFATHIPPTTEDGQPVAVPYDFFDGEVTLHAAHPWVFSDVGAAGRLIPEGPGVRPTTDGGQRHDGWDDLVPMADPGLLGTDCQPGPIPSDAEALAESIQSDPGLGATAPVAVRAGGIGALMMDVQIAAGAPLCAPATDGGDPLGVVRPIFNQDAGWGVDTGVATGVATGEWMRLYLFDVPEGSSMRILVIAIIAPESRFERAVEAAASIIDSIEFHAP